MNDVRTSPIPTAPEVATVLEEVHNQWNLGNDGQAVHLLDALTLAVEHTAGEFAGTKFLGAHLENLANLMNAGGGADLDEEITEMVKVLRHGLI